MNKPIPDRGIEILFNKGVGHVYDAPQLPGTANTRRRLLFTVEEYFDRPRTIRWVRVVDELEGVSHSFRTLATAMAFVFDELVNG